MLRRVLAVSTGPSAGARGIRTQLPPRPAVTVITYLDHYGNPVKTKEETDLSLIRTRDNKFYLQRVFPDESVVRFACPGLGMIKNAANFEYFSLNDIDLYGGIIVPSDVVTSPVTEHPGLSDAVHVIMRCHPTTKFTRKDRRAWHRKLFSHWEEDPEKFQINVAAYLAVGIFVTVYVITRYLFTTDRNLSPFFNDGEQYRDDSLWSRVRHFKNRHPEHMSCVSSAVEMTPAQFEYSAARAELREADFTDPSLGTEWVWKVKHAKRYGHWPKGLNE